MDKIKKELWDNIHESILKYIEMLVEISDRNGYRLRPKIDEDGEIYDHVDTTKLESVEELNNCMIYLGEIIDYKFEQCDPDYGDISYHQGAKDMYELIFKLLEKDNEVIDYINREVEKIEE